MPLGPKVIIHCNLAITKIFKSNTGNKYFVVSCLFLRSRHLLPLIISEFKIQNFKFSNYSLHGCFVSRIVLIWGNTVMKYTLPLPSMMSYYSSSLQQKHNLKVYLFMQWETDMLTKMRKWYIKKIHLLDLYLKFVFTTMIYILMATFIFHFSWNRANLTMVCSKLNTWSKSRS